MDKWVDSKGREVTIMSMSDYWLNNIRKKYKDNDSVNIQPILSEIKRRKEKRKKQI